MSASTAAKFVSRLTVHFPPPRFESAEQEAEWLRSIVESLKRYADDVLELACQQIIDTRGAKAGEKWFPLPAEIRKVCDSVIHDRERPTLVAREEEDYRSNPWSDFRTDLVFDLLKGSAMGHQAAKEGWIGPLVHWVRMNAELPPASMIGTFKIKAQEFDETLMAVHRLEGFPKNAQGIGLAAACGQLGESFNARNKAWTEAILHGASREPLYTRKGWRHRRDDRRIEDENVRRRDADENYIGGGA